MRMYIMIHRIFSGIKAGAQAAHVAAEIVRKNTMATDELRAMTSRWAGSDRTIIILDGGDSHKMGELLRTLQGSPYPFGYFCESPKYAKGLLTGVGIIMPEEKDTDYIDMDPAFYYPMSMDIQKMRLMQ